jgi:hypothetical protein
MKHLLILCCILFITACGNNDEKAVVEEKPAAPLTKSKNSAAFNTSFTAIVDAYFHLKDNFITESEPLLTLYATKMLQATDSLKIDELKGDAGIVENATSFAQIVSAELKAMLGEKDLLAKRKSFNMLSDALYNLIRIVQYDQMVIYQLNTDKAFENENGMATWLSKTKDIKNPYNPQKFLTDGNVLDSLMYQQ